MPRIRSCCYRALNEVCDLTLTLNENDLAETQFISITLVKNGTEIISDAVTAWTDVNGFFAGLGWTIDGNGAYHITATTDNYDPTVVFGLYSSFEMPWPPGEDHFPIHVVSVETDGNVIPGSPGTVNNFTEIGTVVNSLSFGAAPDLEPNFDVSCTGNGISSTFLDVYAIFDHLIIQDAFGVIYDVRMTRFLPCTTIVATITESCEQL